MDIIIVFMLLGALLGVALKIVTGVQTIIDRAA